MTVTAAGRWIGVTLPDGSTRYDWLPDDQPPSPDGAPGSWHVVGAPGEEGHWEWRENRPVITPSIPFALRPLVISYRTAILSVIGVLAVLAAVVAALILPGSDDASSDSVPSAIVVTPAPPSLDFPKQFGPWTLYSLTVERDRSTGAFKGRATLGYTGPGPSAASSPIVIDVIREGRTVGVLTGTAGSVTPGTYTAVPLTSADAWTAKPDGFGFRAG
jgi:hypothetical protein